MTTAQVVTRATADVKAHIKARSAARTDIVKHLRGDASAAVRATYAAKALTYFAEHGHFA